MLTALNSFASFHLRKGSRYHEDLSVMEQLGVLLPGAVVVADNVLKPGSPLFLWRLCKGEAYENHIAPWCGFVGRYGMGRYSMMGQHMHPTMQPAININQEWLTEYRRNKPT